MASDMQRKREKEAGQMIKTRLIKLLSHSKKYIFYTVLWQWIALLTQITAVFTIAQVIGQLVEKTLKDTAQAISEEHTVDWSRMLDL